MSTVPVDELQKLNDEIYLRGGIDREHLMRFLTLIPTNDARAIIQEVKDWLTAIHEDPKYDKIVFPSGDIDSIIGDLDSYGRVRPEHIWEYKQNSTKVLPMV